MTCFIAQRLSSLGKAQAITEKTAEIMGKIAQQTIARHS